MHFQATVALASGNNKVKDLLVAAGFTGPMSATEFSYMAPGPNWTTPNVLDISVGPNNMAALDDGEHLRPGESNRYSPGTGPIDLTQISVRAPDANQRIKLTVNTF